MFNFTAIAQGLDQPALPPHRRSTCGQSHGGGLITSCRTHRSRFLGRVAVAYVQGSPKGGGALCVRRVISTRLRPVPPLNREARVRWGQQTLSVDHRLQLAARTAQSSRDGGQL